VPAPAVRLRAGGRGRTKLVKVDAGPEVRRVLEPLMRAPSELIGAGPVLAFDLRRPGK